MNTLKQMYSQIPAFSFKPFIKPPGRITVEQINWLFDDNWRIIFDNSPYKQMLWVLMWVLINCNICCGYSLASPQRGDSNEYSQHMFLWRNKQNYPSIITKHTPYLFHWYMTLLMMLKFYFCIFSTIIVYPQWGDGWDTLGIRLPNNSNPREFDSRPETWFG